MVLKKEDVIKFAHGKIKDPSDYVALAIEWIYNKDNKYIIFSNFEHVLTYGVQNVDEFKEKLGVVFNHSQYMGMPSSIAKKLTNTEVDVLQEVVETHLLNYYKSDVIKFINAFNRIDVATKELEAANKELESFVTPKKHKMK